MKIIDKLKNKFDQAELLSKEINQLNIDIENWGLENISQENLSRSSLRVNKNNKKGNNTTIGNSKNAVEKLIDGAGKSAEYGDPADYDFSNSTFNKENKSDIENFESTTEKELINFISKFQNFIKPKIENIILFLSLNKTIEKISIITTNGGNLKEKIANYKLSFGAPVPGGASIIYRTLIQPDFFTEIPEDLIDDFLNEYKISQNISSPKTGKMPVLFSPGALYFLFVSLKEGISARSIYRKTSPLLDKLDENIFSNKLTIIDRPHMKNAGGRRRFDDEGTLTTKQEIIKNGKLKNYIYDLEYAARMEKAPKGNGFKKSLFGSGIDTPVSPNMVNAVIKPGNKNKEEIISSVNEGILVDQIIGFHSSNYSQGHFSVQAQGFHIKKGRLQGRLQDVMVSGNIYEDFMNIEEIGSTLYPTSNGYTPYILVDDISVTGK